MASVPQVAAGNAIFNLIVDTDDTAARLVHLLERRRLGRVTFMPLNRLSTREDARFPANDEVVHLIDVSLALGTDPDVRSRRFPEGLAVAGARVPLWSTVGKDNSDRRYSFFCRQVSLKFQPQLKPAMEQLFGKKLLAKDLETASVYADKVSASCPLN